MLNRFIRLLQRTYWNTLKATKHHWLIKLALDGSAQLPGLYTLVRLFWQ